LLIITTSIFGGIPGIESILNFSSKMMRSEKLLVRSQKPQADGLRTNAKPASSLDFRENQVLPDRCQNQIVFDFPREEVHTGFDLDHKCK